MHYDNSYSYSGNADLPSFVKDINLKPGDLVFPQKTNAGIEASQKVVTKGSRFSKATHVGIIAKIDKNSIHILEATRSGIKTKIYDANQFKKYVGKELHVLKNKDLSEDLKKNSGRLFE